MSVKLLQKFEATPLSSSTDQQSSSPEADGLSKEPVRTNQQSHHTPRTDVLGVHRLWLAKQSVPHSLVVSFCCSLPLSFSLSICSVLTPSVRAPACAWGWSLQTSEHLTVETEDRSPPTWTDTYSQAKKPKKVTQSYTSVSIIAE